MSKKKDISNPMKLFRRTWTRSHHVEVRDSVKKGKMDEKIPRPNSRDILDDYYLEEEEENETMYSNWGDGDLHIRD